MALAKFVRNVDDLSDDGGYKFRFRCDRCSDGVESHYVSSSANILKTGLEVLTVFRGFGRFGGGGRRAVDGIDRGLRGKERDAAYEKAVSQASAHFHKCSSCGAWVCGHCWNASVGMCEGCAPDAHEAGARLAARNVVSARIDAVARAGATSVAQVTCPACAQPSGGGKFCASCGVAVVTSRSCAGCNSTLALTAKFCGECGRQA